MASVRPVTDRPPKSPMRCPPADLQTLAAETEDLGVGLARLQLRGERAGIQIA